MNARQIRQTVIAVTMVTLTGAFQPSLASGLRSGVNTARVSFGDSFVLTLSVDAASPASTPDLTPLREHFRILGTSQQSQTSIINGRRTDTFSWVITLTPNEKGVLTIPSIVAGRNSSEPITIEVVDPAVLPSGAPAGGNISIDVTVDPGTHYVQQEIPVTVRILDGLGIREARLEEPSNNAFVLRKTGEDQSSKVTRNGSEVTLFERHYFLKPQKSGSLTIPPLTLVATIENSSQSLSMYSNMGIPDALRSAMGGMSFGSSLFDEMFNRGREVIVRSEPLKLDVKPRPTVDGTWFLPAKRVELHADWSPANPEFRVGDAVTRHIRLFALGASEEQLPDISIANTDGARLYLERTNVKSTDTPEGTAAVREFVVSVVPTRGGDVLLPAIEVRWWDTRADTERLGRQGGPQTTRRVRARLCPGVQGERPLRRLFSANCLAANRPSVVAVRCGATEGKVV